MVGRDRCGRRPLETVAKKGSGATSISYAEALESALCFG